MSPIRDRRELETLQNQKSTRATICINRADSAEVINPKLGEFQTGSPAELAITARPVLGPFRLT